MQPLVIDQPYTFVPARPNRFWHGVTRLILPGQLRKTYGIASIECRGIEKLQASLAAGRGIIIAPNHCRPCDPMVIDSLSKAAGRPFNAMASWHLFMGSRVQRFMIRRSGAFSIYREGADRESLKCAIRILTEGRRPLVLFPEGIVTRSNERLVNLMDGPAFMARTAAKQRPDGMVVIHPVFIRYHFEGDLQQTISPVLEAIEKQASLEPPSQQALIDRIRALGEGLLALKEIEYLGTAGCGPAAGRVQGLIEHLLGSLESKWSSARQNSDAMERVRQLRGRILRDMIHREISAEERASRWKDLTDLYFVQQLYCYPPDYLANATPERMLECVERYEEDLTDVARPHYPLRAVITVGDAIKVTPERDRSNGADPITAELRRRLEALMENTRSSKASHKP